MSEVGKYYFTSGATQGDTFVEFQINMQSETDVKRSSTFPHFFQILSLSLTNKELLIFGGFFEG